MQLRKCCREIQQGQDKIGHTTESFLHLTWKQDFFWRKTRPFFLSGPCCDKHSRVVSLKRSLHMHTVERIHCAQWIFSTIFVVTSKHHAFIERVVKVIFRRRQLMIWHQNWSISMLFRQRRNVNLIICRCKIGFCYEIFDRIVEHFRQKPEL